ALRRRLSGRVAEVRVPQAHEWSLLTLSDLRQLVDVLSQRPDEAQAYAAGLREMVERDPGGVRWLRLLERVLVALGRESEVQVLWGQQLESNALDPSTCRLGLLRAYRRAGQVERVLELMTSAGDSVSAEEAAHFIVATSEVGSDWERAMALALVGRSAKPGVRAVLLATASELLRKHGDVSGARELSESACRSDAHMARAFVSCAEAMGSERSRVAGLIFERACRMTLPRVEWCRALAEVAQQTGNLEQQLKWLRRWASLTPLDTDAASQLINALSLADDVAALEAATDWLLGLPQLSQNSLQPVMLA